MAEKNKKNIRLNLSRNWHGLLSSSFSGCKISPEHLLGSAEKIFKAEKHTTTAVSRINDTPIVFKYHKAGFDLKAVVNLFRGCKAERNFKLAKHLAGRKIAAAEPVAAIWRIKNFSCVEDILITEYLPGSCDLYDVAFGRKPELLNNFKIRKAIIKKTAGLLAAINRNGYWHRDSKAGNFIVQSSDDGIEIKLVDLDGVMPNFLGCKSRQIKTLAKLAETLSRFETINFTDLYRGFLYYCDAMKIKKAGIKKLFRLIERQTAGLRLLTIAADSYQNNI